MQTLLNLVRMTARFFLATKFESIWHKPLNYGHGQGTGSWGPEDCAEVWVHQVQGTMAWGRRLVMGLTGWSEFCGNASYAYGYGSIPIDTFLMGWTSIYQLFWCSPGVQGFDTSPYRKNRWLRSAAGEFQEFFLVAGNRARAVRGSPFPHAAGSRRQNSGGLNLKHFHFVQKLSDTYDTYEYLSRKRIRDYRCHKHTHMIEIHHDTSRCLFCQDMAHEFQAHFVWDVRENVLGGMTIHICPSVHPSRIHTIPLQYITSQSVYIYIYYTIHVH